MMEQNRNTMSAELHNDFRDLIMKRTGIIIPFNRRDSLVHYISNQIREDKYGDNQLYLESLKRHPTESPIWDDFLNYLTIPETYFFREYQHFKVIRHQVLPEILSNQHERQLRIWSAACSTGEEPYSIAMLLHSLIPNIDQWNILILGTDICKKSLRKARAGRYTDWSFRGIDPVIRNRFFKQSGKEIVVNESIRRMVTFDYHNLAVDLWPDPSNNTHAMDIIFFRNISIYFSKSLIQRVADQFLQCLNPAGWLFVGTSETDIEIYKEFVPYNAHGTTVYRKPAENMGLKPAETASKPAMRNPQPDLLDKESVHPAFICQKTGLKQTNFAPQPEMMDTPDPYEKGIALRQQSNLVAAIKLLEKCLIENHRPIDSGYALARIYADMSELDKAETYCRKILENDPLHVDTLYVLSVIYQNRSMRDQAIELLKKVLYIDSSFILAHFNLYHLYSLKNLTREAERHHKRLYNLIANLPPDHVLDKFDGTTVSQFVPVHC